MPSSISGLDHLVVLVRNLDAARDLFGRLGFALSARGFHSPLLGTANHTIMFHGNYLELLGIVQDTEFNARWRRILAHREGLIGLALATDSAEQAHASFNARGVSAAPPVSYARPVEHDDRALGEAVFVSTQLDDAETPGFIAFACEHRTPNLVWIPGLMEHPNASVAIEGVSILADDPASLAKRYARVLDRSPQACDEAAWSVPLGDTMLRFATTDHFRTRGVGESLPPAPAGIGITLRARNLDKVERELRSNTVSFERDESRIWLNPSQCCGVAITFAEQT